jgi:2-amino-4-hydroxy-6-hydroxymethyldihydropteridine diphosphokinase
MGTESDLNQAYLLLGSNLGDSLAILEQAKVQIERKIGLVSQESSLFKTAAWGKTDQPDFINQALEVRTHLSPHALLKDVLAIEKDLGRLRLEHWGPRVIDIDIIFYNDKIISDNLLTLPHQEMHNRRFVLTPLNEIIPDFVHPIKKRTVTELLAMLEDNLSVIKI